MDLKFVTFHADLDRDVVERNPGQRLPAVNIGVFRRTDRYRRMIGMLFESVRRTNPGAACVLLSDRLTEGIDTLGAEELCRFDIDNVHIMRSRLLAQIDYLRSQCDAACAYVLLDSDILVTGSLEGLFAGDFAVCLTQRDDPEMPINGGVIFVGRGKLAEAIRFLEDVLDVYENRYRDRAVWWGDQLSLRDVAERSRTDPAASVQIAFEPCDRYNYSPPYGSVYRNILLHPDRATLWHFKGQRKLAMSVYFHRHVLPGMWRRALAQGLLALLVVAEFALNLAVRRRVPEGDQ